MTKKDLNQNSKYAQKMIDIIEPDFIFSEKPINRMKIRNIKEKTTISQKSEKLDELKKKINSIENCKIKMNSKNLIIGNGNVSSSLMIIGETPGYEEDKSGLAYQGEIGNLLKKMFFAINVNLEDIYKTYSINFRPPNDRKPTTQEIKRYSIFLKEHISIIDPKILILMGTTAMEAVTGLGNQISNERGNWKEIIIGNKTIPVIITFNPSYLIRYPDKKKFSWEDLKKIRKKVEDLNIII